MDSARQRRLFELFDELCDAASSEQRAALDAVEDVQLRAELRAMLSADVVRQRTPVPAPTPTRSPWLVLLGVVAAVVGGFVLRPFVVAGNREAAASRHLEAAERELRRLHDVSRPDEAGAVFEAFARLPEHAGTRALGLGWLHHARRLAADRHPDARRAAALAWINAASDADRSAASIQLASELVRESRWTALARLGEALGPDAPAELDGPLFQAAVALRDPKAIERLPVDREADRRLIEALSVGTSVASGASGAGIVALDGPAIVLDIAGSMHVLQGDARTVLPHPPGHAVLVNRVTTFDGAWVLAAQGQNHTTLFRAVDDGWEPWHALPVGVPQRLQADGDHLLVALSYPARGLFEVPRTGRASRVEGTPVLLDSDVMDVTVADVDGDGDTERVVALGAWTAYDVRVLDGDTPAARRRLGVVEGLAWLDGPQRLLAAKADHSPSVEQLGAERPYGEPAGLYLLTGDLAVERHLPQPIIDRDGPGVHLDDLHVGDLDGDGRPDAVLSIHRTGGGQHLWVVRDVAGAATSLVVAGWVPGGLADMDGDGDDELLVMDARGEVWLLGTGDTAPPRYRDPRVADPVVPEAVRAFTGVPELLRLGLPDDAAASLVRVAAVHGSPAVTGAALLEAASLEESLEHHGAAALLFAQVVEMMGEGSAQWRRAVAGLTRSRALGLDLVGAHTAWRWLDSAGDPAADSLSWLSEVTSVPTVEALGTAGSATGWAFRSPGAVARDARHAAWSVDLFNDEGVVAEAPVALLGHRVGIELAVTLSQAELGSGIEVRIDGPDGERVLGVSASAVGGAGRAELELACAGSVVGPHPATVPLPEGDVRVVLHAERLDALGEVVCRVRVDEVVHLLRRADPQPVPVGPHTLRIAAAGQPAYSPPTRFRGRLDHLRLDGVRWEGGPGSVADAPARALAEGRAVEALATGDAEVRAAAGLALGDVAPFVAWLGTSPVEPALRWALRRYPELATPPVAAHLGARFSAVFLQTWREAARYAPHDDVRRALRLSTLDELEPTSPDALGIVLARARQAWRDGDEVRALRLARHAARSPVGSGTSRRTLAEVHLLLARMHAARGEPELAAEAVTAHVRLAPSPELGRDRVRTHPELRPLLDAQ